MEDKEILKQKILKDKELLKKLQLEEILNETSFRINNIVEFILIGDSYNYEPDEWRKGKIYSFEKNGDTIYANVGHWNLPIDRLHLYNENDYTLRHQVWNRELDLYDKFQLIVDKPKSTKGKIYEIFKIVKEIESQIEYFFYNDHGKPTTLYEGEFHVVSQT